VIGDPPSSPCRDVDVFALELASGDSTGDFITEVEETIEEVIATSTTVVAIFLLLLVLLCLAGCLCYCCHDSAKDKVRILVRNFSCNQFR